ncbi:MAG: hypothetical protein ACLSWI_07365 [Candidatus Gastranaerophilaceae bacterium]
MKFISLLIVPLLTLILVMLVIMNINDTVTLNLVSNSMSGLFGLPAKSLDVNLGGYTFIVFALGEAAAIFFFLPVMQAANSKNSAYQRQLEKTSIDKTENSSRVEVLENKIKVLEKALEDALKRNN